MADLNLEAERTKFEAWAGIEYRNASEYTRRDYNAGLAAWLAAKSDAAQAAHAGAIDEQPRAEQVLRRLLAYRCAGSLLYTDDGELQDSTARPWIDFKRDSVDTIETKLGERCRAAMSAATEQGEKP